MRLKFYLSLLLSALLAAESAPAQNSTPDPQWRACLQKLQSAAVEKNISPATFQALTASLQPDMKVIELSNYQPEFKTSIWDYLAALVDAERIADGQKALHQWKNVLEGVGQRFSVEPAIVAAVWGVETNFGQKTGTRPILSSLATLVCYGRRQKFFEGEFLAALQILQKKEVAPERFTGSWAGAFGHTQFMPSTFLKLAVDFNEDGRRDIVDNIPDALASTANFLNQAGWNPYKKWGFEVLLPENYTGETGRKRKYPLNYWVQQGLRSANGHALLPKVAFGERGGRAADQRYALLLPSGKEGPAFLVTENFDALYAYNASESYAFAIAFLADHLRGVTKPALIRPWPVDSPGLSRQELREVQHLLLQMGYDIGAPDGAAGSKTRQALADFQRRIGLEPGGRPSQKILNILRQQKEARR